MTGRLPQAIEIAWRDPLAAAAAVAEAGLAERGLVLLESTRPGAPLGRYSYLCALPASTMRATREGVEVDGMPADPDPWQALAIMLGDGPPPPPTPAIGLPPFRGGVAGLFGYDLGRHLERLPPLGPDPLGFPDMAVGRFDAVAAFDHERRRTLIVSATPERGEAARRLADIVGRAGSPPGITTAPSLSWLADCGRRDYEEKVRRVVDYIRAGDIFQANLSCRFSAATDEDPFVVYARLRRIAPAPFAALLLFGGDVFLSASPERFLRLADGQVETRPIKGTRPRGSNPSSDRRLAEELLASAKDRAENLMIVDLLRNDLSRACRPGTVRVPELCVLESYATVHHLVSAVTGVLRPGIGPTDLLAACFPGGSITGAPKIRAMEIIAELEPFARGPFFGSLGWIGFDGSMDTNIAIRSLAMRDGRVCLQAGGGIVADSDPAAEYLEMRVKARALFAAAGGEPAPDPESQPA